MVYFFVGLGGIVGTLFRYLLSTFSQDLWGNDFPFGTLFINLTGAYLLGWFTSRFVIPKVLSPYFMVSFSTGVIGSYTTFSTLCLETFKMLDGGSYVKAVVYMFLSLLGGLLFVRLGMSIGGKSSIKVRKME